MNFSSLRYALRGLSAYRTLLDDENESILDYATTVLYTLANGQKEQDEEERAEWGENALSAYACLFQALCDGGFSGIGDWLWDKLRYTETPFALSAQSDGASPALEQAARRDVDALLEVLAKEQPNIPRLSAAGEAEIARQKAEKAARRLPQLSKEAEQSVGQLKRASDYLAKKPELAKELSAAERRKRAQLQSKPVYKYVALIISLFGVVSAAYGIQSIINHTGNYGIYFALFGFAAIFLFSSYNMMPTAHNNRNAIMKRADRAEAAMAEYIKAYPGGNFPVPDIYAHPVVLKQMTDALQEGRAVTLPEALEAVKNRLKEVNADVQVEQEEYDEIVQIKAMFLNHDYQ